MMDDQLKACPFCGAGAELREMAPYPNQRPGEYYATCPSCDIVPDQAWSKPRDEAIAAWNTRPLTGGVTEENAPDFAEMLDVLEDCRSYLTEFGSVEPSSLVRRVNTALTNGKRAKDDRCYREQWAHANGVRAERGEAPLSYSMFLAGGGE